MLDRLALLLSKVLLGMWLAFWYLVLGDDYTECPCAKCELRRMAERGDRQ